MPHANQAEDEQSDLENPEKLLEPKKSLWSHLLRLIGGYLIGYLIPMVSWYFFPLFIAHMRYPRMPGGTLSDFMNLYNTHFIKEALFWSSIFAIFLLIYRKRVHQNHKNSFLIALAVGAATAAFGYYILYKFDLNDGQYFIVKLLLLIISVFAATSHRAKSLQRSNTNAL